MSSEEYDFVASDKLSIVTFVREMVTPNQTVGRRTVTAPRSITCAKEERNRAIRPNYDLGTIASFFE